MGKARIFSDGSRDAVYQKETDNEIYSAAAQQNSYNLGSTHFSDQSGIGNFSQAGSDQRKASVKGALFQGNVGFDQQTVQLDVVTFTINLLNDGGGTAVSISSTDRFVSLSAGTTADLTTITGVQRPGQRLVLYNTLTNTITIKHTAAATANTIRTPDGNDFEFLPDMAVSLTYDISSAQWRIISGGGGGGLSEPVILTINTITPQTLPTTSVVDWSKNPNHITLDRDVEFSFSNLPASGSYEGVLVIIDVDGTGGYAAPVWPASVTNPPTVPTTANLRTSVMLYTIDGGTVVTHATSVGSSVGGNVPDGSAQFQHLEWNGSSWVNQQVLQFGSTPATAGNLRFPNNTNALGWRNAANTGDITLALDTNDEIRFTEADQLEIRNSTTGASGIANFVSYRNDATPTNGDELGSLRFDGNDDGAAVQQYARIIAGIADIVDLSEDGLLQFEVALAGSLIPFIRLNDSNAGNVHFLKDQTFGTNPADDGRVNFANNVIGTSWRNFANTGNVSLTVDTNDDLILDNVDQLQIVNTTTGGSGIANFVSFRNDATPSAGNELGSLRFDGKDDTAETTQYVRFLAGIADETDLSEDGQALIQMAEAGVLISYLSFNLINSGTVGVLKDMDMNANKIDLDLDNDTSIRADTDDEIQFEVGGLDVLKIVAAGGLDWNLSGVDHTLTAGSTTMTMKLDQATDQYLLQFANANNEFIFDSGHVDVRMNGTVGFFFESLHNPTTPIDDMTIGLYQWNGKNSIGTIEPHAELQLTTTDVTDGTEDCDFVFSEMVSGVMTEMMRIDANLNEIKLANGSDIDLTAGNIDNFTQLNADAGAKATITGSRGGNAALASLLSALETYGMINDSTT